MTEEELNRISHYRAPLPSLGKEVEGFVIDEVNGEPVKLPICVLSQRGATAALGLIGGGSFGFRRSLGSSGLAPHLPDDLVEKLNNPLPVKFTLKGSDKSGKLIQGYEVETFISALAAIVGAYMKGVLPSSLHKLAFKANALRDIFARTALDSMIYQESGYWRVIEDQRLSQILDKYLKDYARKWSKTFPDKFWYLLIEIKGYPSYMALKRPSFVGRWVNDLIYERLAPNIREELAKRSPRTSPSGARKYKFHQFLTEDHGMPALKEHIIKVTTLMEVAKNKDDFTRMLDKTAPKFDKTIPLNM